MGCLRRSEFARRPRVGRGRLRAVRPGTPQRAAVGRQDGLGRAHPLRIVGRSRGDDSPFRTSGPRQGARPAPAKEQEVRRRGELRARRQARPARAGDGDALPQSVGFAPLSSGAPACGSMDWRPSRSVAADAAVRLRRVAYAAPRIRRGVEGHLGRGLQTHLSGRPRRAAHAAPKPRDLDHGGDRRGAVRRTDQRQPPRPGGPHIPPGVGHRPIRRLVLHLDARRDAPCGARHSERRPCGDKPGGFANLRSRLRHGNFAYGRRRADKGLDRQHGRRIQPRVGRENAMGIRRQPDGDAHGRGDDRVALAKHGVPEYGSPPPVFRYVQRGRQRRYAA